MDLRVNPTDLQLSTDEIPTNCTVKLPEGVIAPKETNPFPLLSGLDSDAVASTSQSVSTTAKESSSATNVDDVPTIGMLTA